MVRSHRFQTLDHGEPVEFSGGLFVVDDKFDARNVLFVADKALFELNVVAVEFFISVDGKRF